LVVHTTMYLEYHTVVVLCYLFWFWREIVLVLGTYLVYNTVVWLCQLFCCGGKVLLRPEKKSSSRLSSGYAIVITTGKKGRDRCYDRKKKSSRQLWCCVIFFGSGGK
jgi:hypothetical protein